MSENQLQKKIYNERICQINTLVENITEKKDELNYKSQIEQLKQKLSSEKSRLWNQIGDNDKIIIRLKHERETNQDRLIFLEDENSQLLNETKILKERNLKLESELTAEIVRSKKYAELSSVQ